MQKLTSRLLTIILAATPFAAFAGQPFYDLQCTQKPNGAAPRIIIGARLNVGVSGAGGTYTIYQSVVSTPPATPAIVDTSGAGTIRDSGRHVVDLTWKGGNRLVVEGWTDSKRLSDGSVVYSGDAVLSNASGKAAFSCTRSR